MASQRAAEHLVKGIAVRRYIEPRKSRNIAAIANDLRHQKPQDLDTKLWSTFADRIAALDGFSLRDNQTAYAITAPMNRQFSAPAGGLGMPWFCLPMKSRVPSRPQTIYWAWDSPPKDSGMQIIGSGYRFMRAVVLFVCSNSAPKSMMC